MVAPVLFGTTTLAGFVPAAPAGRRASIPGMRGVGQRQHHAHRGALALRALELDVPVMPGHNFLDDVQAQPEAARARAHRSEEHTSELQSRQYLVCRLLPEKNIS